MRCSDISSPEEVTGHGSAAAGSGPGGAEKTGALCKRRAQAKSGVEMIEEQSGPEQEWQAAGPCAQPVHLGERVAPLHRYTLGELQESKKCITSFLGIRNRPLADQAGLEEETVPPQEAQQVGSQPITVRHRPLPAKQRQKAGEGAPAIRMWNRAVGAANTQNTCRDHQ